MGSLPYPIAIIGTIIVVVGAFLAKVIGDGLIKKIAEPKELGFEHARKSSAEP